jgi:hypothetical protein
LSLKVLQITLFVGPLVHAVDEAFQVPLEVGIETEIEGVVVGVEGRGCGGEGVEEGGYEVGIVDFEGEFFEDVAVGQVMFCEAIQRVSVCDGGNVVGGVGTTRR